RDGRAPPDPHSRRDERAGAHAAGGAAPSPDGDWGYLPPEPAGLHDVKGVVPLPLKKR
ncbi:magnesium chelatase, partial [Burkholderia vietnamiensis]|nr:magnesium chelatase [Burkholderia vietnamiensis]